MQCIDEYEPRRNIDIEAELLPRISVPLGKPHLLYGLGLARSGTTVSLNYISRVNTLSSDGEKKPILSSYQHLKAGLRQAMHGWPADKDERWMFHIPDKSISPVLYIKDPLGPYTKTEATFNAVQLLELKDYPKELLFLIFFVRDPLEIFASWIVHWGKIRDKLILRQNLAYSFQHLQKLHQEALQKGYNHYIFVYEHFESIHPSVVIKKLLESINTYLVQVGEYSLDLTHKRYDQWDKHETNVLWNPNEPEMYKRTEIENLHTNAKTSSNIRFKKYSQDVLDELITSEDVNFLIHEGVFDIYRYFLTFLNTLK